MLQYTMGRPKTAYMEFVRQHSKEYAIWSSMKQRCCNPKCHEFENYGGRGITVCSAWNDSFLAFLSDVGSKPENSSLDRIDNNLGYSKENCRWVTSREQNRNKRVNRILTLNGETLCLSDWANRIGIHHQTLRNRLRRGWTLEESLSLPRIQMHPGASDGRYRKQHG